MNAVLILHSTFKCILHSIALQFIKKNHLNSISHVCIYFLFQLFRINLTSMFSQISHHISGIHALNLTGFFYCIVLVNWDCVNIKVGLGLGIESIGWGHYQSRVRIIKMSQLGVGSIIK